MTIIKKTKTTITQGNNTTTEETTYFEVGAAEMDRMLLQVEKGGDEKKLREELIKKSNWGEE